MLSKQSVRRPFTVIVAIILVAILGVVSYMNMTVDLLPNLNLPYVVVVTSYPGASPEVVETTVTRSVEQSMSTISNVKNIQSVSSEHLSMIILEFVGDTNMDTAVIEIRESLDMIKAFFPDDVGSPMLMKINPSMMPVMVLSAYVEGEDIGTSSSYIEQELLPEIEGVEGVGSVSAMGLLENMVNVTISEAKLDKLNADIAKAADDAYNAAMAEMFEQIAPSLPAGTTPDMLTPEMLSELGIDMPEEKPEIPVLDVTADMLEGILMGQNFAMPTGSIEDGNSSYLVRTGDKLASVEDVRNLTVFSIEMDGFENVTLSDIADIEELTNAGDQYAKVSGNDAVMLTIQKQSEYSTADVTKRVWKKLDLLEKDHAGVKFDSLMDQGDYVNIMVSTIIKNLLLGGVLAIIILLLFLKSAKSTFIVGMSIIISVTTALVLMYFSGITMNVISMGGLAVGIGMLVDNSIVVIENIFRLRSEGKSTRDAAIDGAKQVSGAIIASTITTIIVFVPIVFTSGITRQLFVDMGLTIAFSLIASLVTALTFVPMAFSLMYKNYRKPKERFFNKFRNAYGKALNFTLDHKWIVITFVVVMLGVTGGVIYKMDKAFFPQTDMGMISITANIPDDYSKEDVYVELDEISKIIGDIDEVETVGAMYSDVGQAMISIGGMGGSDEDSATIYALLSDDRKISTSQVSEIIRDRTKDIGMELSISGDSMDMSMMAGQPVSIEIYGRDLDTLRELSKDVTDIVNKVDGTIDIDDGLGKPSQEVRIIVDKEKSMAHGLTVAQVFTAVNEELADTDVATQVSDNATSTDYDIYVYDDRVKTSSNIDDIKNIEIESPMGGFVKVGDISQVDYGEGFTSINRTNQERVVTVSASLSDGYSADSVNTEITSLLDEYQFPEGYRYKLGGEMQVTNEAFGDLLLMLILAIAFIYLVMVAQFQSLLSPFIVMFTIPLAFTGSFLLLFALGMELSIVAMIGIIILVGVVVNNGIVFVDYVNQLRESGYDNRDALITAGRDRIRPILMTAGTTIFALATALFDNSQGAEMMKPIAAATMGGLIYATILTLFLIPVIYDIFHRKPAKIRD